MLIDSRAPSLSLLSEAAATVARSPELGRTELEFIQRCALDFASYGISLQQAIENETSDDPLLVPFPTVSEQMGVLGILEMLTASSEPLRQQFIPKCLQVLDFLSHLQLVIEEEDEDDSVVLGELDVLMCQTCQRLFKLALLFPDWSKSIISAIWKWCNDLYRQINNQSRPFHVRLAAAALIGIFRSVKAEHAPLILQDPAELRVLLETAFSEEKFRIISQAWILAPRDMSLPPVTIDGYGALQWIASVFGSLRDMLAGLLDLEGFSSSSFSDVWSDLGKTRSASKIASSPAVEETIASVFRICWRTDWRQWLLRHSNCDQESMWDVAATVVPGLVQSLNAILEETSLVFDPTPLDVFLAAIEGLEILSVNAEELANLASKSLIKFLVQPANVFVNASDDSACAILRECACRSLSNILSRGIDASQRKTALYTFANTLHATHQKIISATTAKSDVGRRYQNAIAAIASLCSALKSKETIDVAIPALARRLDDSQTIFDEFIWMNLGNIGLTDDTEVFRQIITFILDYSKRTFSKISKISHTLARMPGRPAALLEIYLEKLLALFVEKATVLQRQYADAAVIAELRDIMGIVKVICEQEDFHPQLSSTSNSELVGHFRNAWFYLVLFVLSPAGTWPKDWQTIVKVVASKTPPLILDRQRRSLEADLGANSILQGTFPEPITNKVRTLLTTMLTNKPIDLRNVSLPSFVYLLAVYHIESLRIRTMSIDFMCRYLVDERLYGTDVYAVVETIAEEVMRLLIREQSSRAAETRVVEHNLQCMLLYSAHRLSRPRNFAAKWSLHILETVPRMLWNQRAGFLMMDILRFLDARKAGTSEEGFKGSMFAKLQYIDKAEIIKASRDFMSLGEAWLKMAVKRSARETMGMVQMYLVDVSNKSPYTALEDQSDLMILLSRFASNSEIAPSIIRAPGKQTRYLGEIRGMLFAHELASPGMDREDIMQIISKSLKADLRKAYRTINEPNFAQRLNHSLFRSVALIIVNDAQVEAELLQLVCFVPTVRFDPVVMEITLSAWGWLMKCRPDLVKRVLAYLIQSWELTAAAGKGLYGTDGGSSNPFQEKMTYGPPQSQTDEADLSCVHMMWVRFLIERFRTDRLRGTDHVRLYAQLFEIAARSKDALRVKWAAREARFDLASLGIRIALELDAGNHKEAVFIWTMVFDITLGWFEQPPMFGRITKSELGKLVDFYSFVKEIRFGKNSSTITTRINRIFFNACTDSERVELADAQQLVLVLLEHELNRLATWLLPVDDGVIDSFGGRLPPPPNERLVKWPFIVRTAWNINPIVAVQLPSRFVTSAELIQIEIAEVSKFNEISCIQCPEASLLFLKNAWQMTNSHDQYLLYWSSVPPIQAISMLGQTQRIQPWVLQYAVRVLEYFPIDQVFFFVPQMVQALRDDSAGYIERFILEAARSSQLFAHQIIWNMKANMYKDEACEVPDSLKTTLDRIISKIISSLSGSDKAFYEREFDFFAKVTGISGTLKPLVQADASKAEKKRKIDEELRKIKVQVGVYLPTNPESIVIDIDYDSGRPLQSHAKAPFMATFKVTESGAQHHEPRWMSSIFKVGDDCRQDLLALQLIGIFKSIFVSAGLDLYTFPYRVVATAPGCGVIEVIPRSISRDTMGREKVNSLYEYVASLARWEFIKSLAAYSLIMFILQIKDRHNGNIMFDKEGHIIHIDFGFILSIAPGGGILEVSPFKLTNEMVQVMGGDVASPGYRAFSELCVKAYLACRPYAEEIISMVSLMMGSGLPCFKGEVTIRKLRERFQLDKTERGAAEFMLNCIRQSHENTRSGLYDTFQYFQNGIPYKLGLEISILRWQHMSGIWESVKKHTRRWSSGPAKLSAAGFSDERRSNPIRMQLGDSVMVYEGHQWRRAESGDRHVNDLAERNRILEGENQLLHFKVNVLLDMVPTHERRSSDNGDGQADDDELLLLGDELGLHAEDGGTGAGGAHASAVDIDYDDDDLDAFVEKELLLQGAALPADAAGSAADAAEGSRAGGPSAAGGGRLIANEVDGVFANMAAKPDNPSMAKTFEEIEPPSYTDAVGDPSPPGYFDTTVTTGVTEDGEVLIDGMPVGDFVSFAVNVFVSMTFDFLGFLITSLLATSHAAKFGSQCGLGLTLIRLGFFLKDRPDEPEDYGQYNQGYVPDPAEERQRREWSAFLLLIIGFFVCLRSFAEYIRVRRMRNVIQATPAAFAVLP
ncbi:Phosphatidylinositol 4-kinase stt4 [Polyrhizophydium stewartii]|uniref:1-phosphatidylinositol 4-kinase n=1 Tax=Polyrhizophydium stewartii TaxID=2732419 RepID=A0ABR4NEE2_9FUNG